MPNHLASETSPYLQQHVNNPVDWYPWGEDALALSRSLDRPIFLSIGYSACHWCHVMEHESFENHDIAQSMNQWFVCIKVDREERPDLDQIYMNAVQIMTGSGGWPMSVFLSPDLKPFFGGTYWPPTARWGRPGFREILAGVHDAWMNRRDQVNSQADELTEHLCRSTALPISPLNDGTLRRAMGSILQSADLVHGGFGTAPKFPHPMDLRLAMRCWKRFVSVEQRSTVNFASLGPVRTDPVATQTSTTDSRNAEKVLSIVVLTLDKMARGGIYDHLGGGFARYSTDERWLVPHFEKMLYDNAQLVPAYLEAFQITGRTDFSQVARETLDYVLREMTQPQGGFYSTQDADSEGVEGKFFVWSEDEVDAILEKNGPQTAISSDQTTTPISTIFKRYYDITRHGNWEHSNILNRPMTHEQAVATFAVDPIELNNLLADCRKALFEVRSNRVWPGRDEKVLVSWNGLMIAAMAIGANVLNEPRYAEAARAAADFILEQMFEIPSSGSDGETASHAAETSGAIRNRTGTTSYERPPHDGKTPSWIDSSSQLRHCYKDGRVRFNAYLDDYAAFIDGLCELYQAVYDAKYLEAAIKLAERMIAQFWDTDNGGFFFTSRDHETLIARNKDTQDNATPSGNSLAAMGLLKLARLTGRMDLEEKAIATLESISGQLDRSPLSAGLSLMALDFLLGPTSEIVIAQGATNPLERPQGSDVVNDHVSCPSIARLHRRFLPNKVVHWQKSDSLDEALSAATSPVLLGKVALGGITTGYVCNHGTCGMPIVGEQELIAAIDRM